MTEKMKKSLYESIMKDVSKTIKEALSNKTINESANEDVIIKNLLILADHYTSNADINTQEGLLKVIDNIEEIETNSELSGDWIESDDKELIQAYCFLLMNNMCTRYLREREIQDWTKRRLNLQLYVGKWFLKTMSNQSYAKMELQDIAQKL